MYVQINDLTFLYIYFNIIFLELISLRYNEIFLYNSLETRIFDLIFLKTLFNLFSAMYFFFFEKKNLYQ